MTSMTGWIATVALSVATVVASLSPCAAQRKDFRPPSPQQKRQAEQNQNRPQAQHPGQGHAGDWLRRYKNVPPGEQERALQSDPAFRQLPPERQQMLRERLQHFSGLPPEQQQRMLDRMETWEHLTPEQKQQAREIHSQLQQLPQERRGMVTTAVRHLSAMPPEQRERIINSERFKNMFSPQEREIMSGAAKLPLAPPENGKPGEPPPPEQ
jgi:hypothetical protein